MKRLEATANDLPVRKSSIRWKRMIAAGFLAELVVIVLISAIIGTYMFVISPGRSPEDYAEFGELAGYYTAAPAAAVATFLMAFWAVRKLETDFVTNGFLVGVIGTLLTMGIAFSARPEDRLMYILSFVARLLGGYAAGTLVQKMRRRAQ